MRPFDPDGPPQMKLIMGNPDHVDLGRKIAAQPGRGSRGCNVAHWNIAHWKVKHSHLRATGSADNMAVFMRDLDESDYSEVATAERSFHLTPRTVLRKESFGSVVALLSYAFALNKAASRALRHFLGSTQDRGENIDDLEREDVLDILTTLMRYGMVRYE